MELKYVVQNVAAGQDTVRIYVSQELKQRFKVLSVLEKRDMSEIAAELIEQWVLTREKEREQERNPQGE